MPVEYLPPLFNVHNFTRGILDKKIVIQVIQMVDSILIYINEEDDMVLKDLSLAMVNRFSTSPVTTTLKGEVIGSVSALMASRLTKKLNKTVFLSCNMDNEREIQLVEKELKRIIEVNPNVF